MFTALKSFGEVDMVCQPHILLAGLADILEPKTFSVSLPVRQLNSLGEA
jgi:hypothetical protein